MFLSLPLWQWGALMEPIWKMDWIWESEIQIQIILCILRNCAKSTYEIHIFSPRPPSPQKPTSLYWLTQRREKWGTSICHTKTNQARIYCPVHNYLASIRWYLENWWLPHISIHVHTHQTNACVHVHMSYAHKNTHISSVFFFTTSYSRKERCEWKPLVWEGLEHLYQYSKIIL